MGADANKELIAQSYAAKIGQLYAGVKAPKVLKPQKAADPSQTSEPHLSNQTLVKGNLFKGTKTLADGQKIDATYYPWNAWNFIGAVGKPNRDAYNGSAKGMTPLPDGYAFHKADLAPNFNCEYKRSDLDEVGIKSCLSSAKGSSDAEKLTRKWYQRLLEQSKKQSGKTGQSLPYRWDAHHILPMSAFFRYLSAPQIQIILASDYDINSGENMIMLPKQAENMVIHGLPGHWSDHPQYTQKLQSAFQEEVIDVIEELQADSQPHDAIEAKIEENLHAMEDSQFDLLKSLGPVRLV